MNEPDKQVELIEVIRTTLTRAGTGKTPESPLRRVIQYWSMDGELLATVDDLAPTHCNAIGHVVRSGSNSCEHCDARIGQDWRMP